MKMTFIFIAQNEQQPDDKMQTTFRAYTTALYCQHNKLFASIFTDSFHINPGSSLALLAS